MDNKKINKLTDVQEEKLFTVNYKVKHLRNNHYKEKYKTFPKTVDSQTFASKKNVYVKF